jgi:hypothetical protein
MTNEKIETELAHAKEQAKAAAEQINKLRVAIERSSVELEQWKGAVAAYENLLKGDDSEQDTE